MPQPTDPGHGKPQIVYSVNGEEQETDRSDLTMGEIVGNAGFTPVEEYTLEDDANHKVYSEAADPVKVHTKQRFTVTYRGVTPTSGA